MAYTLGVDIGSSSSKALILENGVRPVSSAAVQVGTGTSGPSRVLKEVFRDTGLSWEDMAYTVATGYGRFSVDNEDKQVSEITCHTKGIASLFPAARTIIDIGGQDAKAIRLDEHGRILQFYMNDKCAAGTGRFLDVMSRVLEVPLEKMGEVHFQAGEWAAVSSTCTVFAESEVISQLAKGVDRKSIVAGVHKSVATKTCSLVRRCGELQQQIVMCGGVAQNAGVVDAMEQELGAPITVAPNPQLTGALGAALLAWEAYQKQLDME